MPRRWNAKEEKKKREQLHYLYKKKNKTIYEIAEILGIKYNSVYDRIVRLGVGSSPERKKQYKNKKQVSLPRYSGMLAEFFGIMFGDGHISKSQIIVTMNAKDESEYVEFVSSLIEKLFKHRPGRHYRSIYNTVDLYLGSVSVLNYLKKIGLYSTNKVRDQIDAPEWIKNSSCYMKSFVRGFFDTDGSVYRLRSGGIQMSFTNKAYPLLHSTRKMLQDIGLHPSEASHVFYITRKQDLQKYIRVIGFSNPKHWKRFRLYSEV